ncbi:MAG TPA: hypothetical protein VIW78_00510, partial [Burkholderiales bacterium]
MRSDRCFTREARWGCRARARATTAADAFAKIGWLLMEASCRELGGDVSSALAIYRRTGRSAQSSGSIASVAESQQDRDDLGRSPRE